ncbi:MAG: zinc ribbon domain-containing protein [archaeon]|nr:MAG: zinc ribbon domain-containing protein [archaeon]
MPYCNNCGKEFVTGTKFCPNCGTPQQVAQQQAAPSLQESPPPPPQVPVYVPAPRGPPRPNGVTALMVLEAFAGVLILLIALSSLSLPGVVAGAILLGVVLLVLGTATLAAFYGIFRLKPWAWTVALWSSAGVLAFGVLALITGAWQLGVPSILFGAYGVYYLRGADARAFLGRPAGAKAAAQSK